MFYLLSTSNLRSGFVLLPLSSSSPSVSSRGLRCSITPLLPVTAFRRERHWTWPLRGVQPPPVSNHHRPPRANSPKWFVAPSQQPETQSCSLWFFFFTAATPEDLSTCVEKSWEERPSVMNHVCCELRPGTGSSVGWRVKRYCPISSSVVTLCIFPISHFHRRTTEKTCLLPPANLSPSPSLLCVTTCAAGRLYL